MVWDAFDDVDLACAAYTLFTRREHADARVLTDLENRLVRGNRQRQAGPLQDHLERIIASLAGGRVRQLGREALDVQAARRPCPAPTLHRAQQRLGAAAVHHDVVLRLTER